MFIVNKRSPVKYRFFIIFQDHFYRRYNLLWLDIDRSKNISLSKQIFQQISSKILKNEVKSGEKLPSTRKLANELNVSRNVMIEVYEQLIAEGYIESIKGSGTYVAKGTYLDKYKDYYQDYSESFNLNKKEKNNHIIKFQCGIPDLDYFPRELWAKCIKNACYYSQKNILTYGNIKGLFDLRIEILKYLLKIKGIRCEPDQVFIISGSAQAFLLLSKLFNPTYNEIIIEDPVVTFISNIFMSMGLKLNPIEVDQKGLVVDKLPKYNKSSCIFVSPSHQFPLGGTLPIQRRIKLIEYARDTGSYIIEDDYDSEFRFSGNPISSLHLLAPEHVIHIGTFSKNLAPALRLGYMIIPKNLVKKCKKVKIMLNMHTSSLKQQALTYFIKEGYLERHIIKMKKIYQNKNTYLIKLLKEAFNNSIKITGETTGMHLVVEFINININDKLKNEIQKNNIEIYYVEEYAIKNKNHKNKILLGYGNLNLEEIKEGVKRIKNAIKTFD